MAAYYNEIEPFAAAWLRELIKRELIAPGDVDERSIVEVQPDDVRGYAQCHFFAGIGVWSYALFNAGWGDADPVWTGSCPCQPFSTAGKGEGFNDPRHLWPHWHRLIRECRPDVVFGEQVASKAGRAWFDVVSADMEALGYAIGPADTCAASVGAPHIRQRIYFVADANTGRGWRDAGAIPRTQEGAGWRVRGFADRVESGCAARIMGNTEIEHLQRLRESRALNGRLVAAGGSSSGDVLVGDAKLPAQERQRQHGGALVSEQEAEGPRLSGATRGLGESNGSGSLAGNEATAGDGHGNPADAAGDGPWSDVAWLRCRDGKCRPTQPGLFPLAHGAPARVGRLRGYGNAIVAEQAQAFIEAYLDVCEGR